MSSSSSIVYQQMGLLFFRSSNYTQRPFIFWNLIGDQTRETIKQSSSTKSEINRENVVQTSINVLFSDRNSNGLKLFSHTYSLHWVRRHVIIFWRNIRDPNSSYSTRTHYVETRIWVFNNFIWCLLFIKESLIDLWNSL